MHRLEIILMRHGISQWNKDHVHQGQDPKDPGLAEEGIAQAARAADFLRDEHILCVYSSPLPRARETAMIIHKGHRRKKSILDVPLIHNYGLMEITQGDADGMPFKAIKEKFPDGWRKWEERMWHEPIFPRSEAPIQAAERSYATHRKIGKDATIFKRNSKNPEGKIIVVSHGALNCFFLCKITNTLLNEGWDTFPQDNCCINRLIWDNEKERFEVLSINETSHLGNLRLTPLVEI